MAKYHKILAAVDGSEASLHALQETMKLEQDLLTVVSVAPEYTGDLRLMGMADIKAVMREPCETALDKAHDMADAAGISIKTVCAIGDPHEGIVDLAESENCDLIVMGAKGHTFAERVLIGRVTRRVIGYTNIDTLIIPNQATIAWDKILVTTDGSPNSQPSVDRGLELAQAYGSELKILSVLELPRGFSRKAPEAVNALVQEREAHVKDIQSQAESLKVKCKGTVLTGPPDHSILALAQDRNVNLIIMGSHGRTGLKRLLMGSVVEKVIGQAPCPVLVVKV